MRKRAGVYGRESEDNRESVDDQVREQLDGCETREWIVTAVYTDGTSASRFRRKVRGGWERLTADVAAGNLDVVVVWETSRGDRDLETWVPFVAMCRRLGVLIHVESHRRTYDPRNLRDWKSLIEDGLDAAYETEKTSVRVGRGMASQVAKGRPHGRTTYGHERIYGPEDGKLVRQQPHPEHAPIVRAIIERIAKGDPINLIQRELNEAGVPAPETHVWRNSTIRAIALNPAHIGKRLYRGELHRAIWPGLVSEDTFRRAQRILLAPERVASAPGALKYLLSYLATAPCGAPLAGNTFRTAGHRARYSCLRDGCVSIMMTDADAVVRDVLVARLARDDARALLVSDDAEADEANAEADQLQARLDEARVSFLSIGPGALSATAYAEQENKFKPLIEAARTRARQAASVTGLAELIDAAQRSEAEAQEAWDGKSIPVQRGIVRTVVTVSLTSGANHKLSRWATDDMRRAAAWERLTITPR